MATHDYVIANGTGAAVRSDLNDALAAIVSNNSSSSEPATTYAYQWWADTTANVLKIRNSANNAWITLRELDGTLLMEDGSNSAPGLSFASDTNTGFFSGGADKIGFATGGVERLEIGSSEVVFNDPSNDVDFRVESNGNTHMLFVDAGNDRIGIGTSAPATEVAIIGTDGSITFGNSHSDEHKLSWNEGSIILEADPANLNGSSSIQFKVDATERARIDSSGRVLIGASSSANVGFAHGLQVESLSSNRGISIIQNSNDQFASHIDFAKTRGTSTGSNTAVQSGDNLGSIIFRGADGTDKATSAAYINCEVDGTPGSNDMPGRLILATTADGASSSTERLRIDSSGRLLAGTTSSSGNFRAVFQGNSGNSSAGGDVVLARGAATPANAQALGLLGFSDSTHTASGVIQCNRDGGTWSSSSKPTLMAFQLCLDGSTTPTERMRITNAGIVNIGNNGNRSLNVPSMSLANATDDDSYFVVNSAASVLSLNRQSNDGDLIRFFQAGSQEGKISVSGSTVSYNGGHLSRWSQTLTTAEHAGLLKGTVMTNLDEMCEWAHAAQDAVLYTEEDELPEGVSVGDVKTSAVDAYTEENEQLNKMAVSSVEGDPNVAGVMVDVDDEGDLNVAMTGDFVIRIAQGTTVARGDLLMSAGDGTAKPQDDDIVRSKTIAKVTSTTVSTTYADGSYCVPCVLMAC